MLGLSCIKPTEKQRAVSWSRASGLWSHCTLCTISIWLVLHSIISLVTSVLKEGKHNLIWIKCYSEAHCTRQQSGITKHHRLQEMKCNERGRDLQTPKSLIKINVTCIQCFYFLICFYLVVKTRSAQISILAPKLVFQQFLQRQTKYI